MNHFLYGATIPFLIGAFIYVLRRGRASLIFLVVLPLAMVVAGTWAVAPDLPRLTGLHDLQNCWIQNPGMDIFLWHYTLDSLETSPAWYSVLERDSSWFAAGIVLEAAALMAAALRELFREAAR